MKTPYFPDTKGPDAAVTTKELALAMLREAVEEIEKEGDIALILSRTSIALVAVASRSISRDAFFEQLKGSWDRWAHDPSGPAITVRHLS